MEGVTLIETSTLNNLMLTIENVGKRVEELASQVKDSKSPYMTTQELMEYTKFKKDWVNDNKHLIGFRMVSGQLRFRRSDVTEFMEQNNFKAKRK